MQIGQYTDGCATGQEIHHHLRCDFGRKGRHAFGRYPVVGGKNRHSGLETIRRWRGQTRREPDGEVFQLPQTTGWFGELGLAFACSSRERGIRLSHVSVKFGQESPTLAARDRKGNGQLHHDRSLLLINRDAVDALLHRLLQGRIGGE